MKIRIVPKEHNEWIIQKKYWFWPAWSDYKENNKVLIFTDKKKAMMTADKLMDPIAVQRKRKDGKG